MRVGVYVDAFNVYYGGRSLCGRGSAGWRWLDVAGLAMGLISPRLWPNARLATLVYCTAPRNRRGDPSSLADQREYIGALRHACPQLTVVYGRYAPRTKTGVLVDRRTAPLRRVPSPGGQRIPPWLPVTEVVGPTGATELLLTVSTFEEKGSDVNVASSLLIDVLTKQIDGAVVLSNDSDLEFPLAQARLRIPIATVNPSSKPVASALRGSATDGAGRHWWRRLTEADFRHNQLPDSVGPFRRPVGW
jgi:hypothetical protein